MLIDSMLYFARGKAGEKMDSQEHKRYLIQVKDEAQAVIRREQFRSLVQDFLRRYDLWRSKLTECQETAKQSPLLIIGKDVEPGKSPQPGWEVEARNEYLLYVNEFNERYGINGTFRRRFWRPPLPPNPVELLMPVDSFNRVIQKDDNLTPDRPRDAIKDNKERLVAHAFLIAVVCCKLSDGIIDIELPDTPTDDVWGYYGELDNIQEYHRGDKTRSKLRDALTEAKYACTEITQSAGTSITELAYLERFLELLEKLQAVRLRKHTEEQINILIEQINRHIGSLEKFVDTLRYYESKHGFCNDRTKRAIECASAAQQERGGSGIYGALWFDFAHEKVLSVLRSWIKEASTKPAETEQKVKRKTLMIVAKSSQENWEAIRSEYDISKKEFGKKINFVKDSFKRKVIFRDVEHAFVLASQEFSKPAIILAGGVIEELLRLYLEHKNIPVGGDKFFDYIKACEDKGLLKRGVLRLTDSVRDFRNMVHLANEEGKKHTITKATAKGAVSAIFTIIDNFQ